MKSGIRIYIAIMETIAKVRENIEAEALVDRGDRILVSLSGGPDSTTLLYSLASVREEIGFELAAVYLNHNLRPKYIGLEIDFCRRICRELEVEFILESCDIRGRAREYKQSIESAARDFRRETLERLADERNFDKIAVGHHQDDTLETILFRLFRGTGPGGLFPIRPKTDRYIRPLYNIPKKDILEYLKKNKLDYMLDHTNEESDFSRNYIRNEIIPVVEGGFGDKYRRSLLAFAEIVHGQDLYLRSLAARKLRKITAISPGKKIVVDLDRFASYDLPLKRIMAKILLEKAAGMEGFGTFDEVGSLIELAEKNQTAFDLSSGLRAAGDRDKLILWSERTEIVPREIDVPSQIIIDELNASLRIRVKDKVPKKVKAQKGGNRVFLDFGRIHPPLSLRGIANGDRFSPFGMKGSKKLGDLLTDRKISKYLRDEIPVIEDERGIVWVVGIEIDNRVKITEKTRKVLEIDFSARNRRNERI